MAADRVCGRPGCVAAAVADGACAIHRSGAGKACDFCRGAGRLRRLNELSNQYVDDPCDRCGGTGLKDQRRSVRVSHGDIVPVDERGLIRKAAEQ